jgi:hypothetical protein
MKRKPAFFFFIFFRPRAAMYQRMGARPNQDKTQRIGFRYQRCFRPIYNQFDYRIPFMHLYI